MKICFLVNEDDNHSMRWVNYFKANGYDVSLLKVKRLKSKLGEIVFNLFSVRRQIKEINPDILHVHYAGVNGALGVFSGFHPFFLTVHGSDILVITKSIIKRKLVKFILKKADLITSASHYVIKAMENLGADVSKIKVINMGTDVEKFKPGEKNLELKEKLGIADSLVVISIRVFQPIYDVGTLIKAIPLILKEVPNVKFIIAGGGPEEDNLKNLAKDLGVFDKIKFLGWLKDEELPDYFRVSDVYVSTALSDGGLASSTMEAMASGLSVVVSDFGDNSFWVKEGESGCLFPLKDFKTLAEKVIYLLKNKELRMKFARTNREIIKEKNNYFKEMAKMEEIYQKYL